MSKALAAHLGLEETHAAALISKLERLSGFQSEDNRLLAESLSRAKSKIAGLGLDPSDTTAKELYHALLARLADDSHQVLKSAGLLAGSKVETGARVLADGLKLIDMPREAWVLKRSALKDMLRAHPPRSLMRRLKYRSLESMLKREDVDELLIAVNITESPSWRRSFYRGFNSLTPADFEIRQVGIKTMGNKKWDGLNGRTSVSLSHAGGTAALWPQAEVSPAHWLGSFLAVLEAVEIIRLESFSLMIRQTRPDFGRLLARHMEIGAEPPAFISSQPVSWRNLNHYYGRLPKELHPALTEPYMQQIDLHKVSPAAALSSLFPSMRWWADNDHLGWTDTKHTISLNPADVALNLVNGSRFHASASRSFRLSFWEELLSRYLRHQGVEGFILKQISSSPLAAKTALRPNGFALEFQPELQRI